MNFQVGDKVVDIESLSLWDNVYHWKNTLRGMRVQVVTQVSEMVFTCLPDFQDIERFPFGDKHRDNSHLVYQQKNGVPWDGHPRSQMVNITRNKANLITYLEKKFQERFKKCDEDDASEIQKLEGEIRALQNRIDAVKAGKRPVSFERSIVERDFLTERRDAIMSLINQEG